MCNYIFYFGPPGQYLYIKISRTPTTCRPVDQIEFLEVKAQLLTELAPSASVGSQACTSVSHVNFGIQITPEMIDAGEINSDCDNQVDVGTSDKRRAMDNITKEIKELRACGASQQEVNLRLLPLSTAAPQDLKLLFMYVRDTYGVSHSLTSQP